MAVNFPEQGEIYPVQGIELGTASVNIKNVDPAQPRDDVAVISISPGSCSSALFTRSGFKAAPVILAEQRIRASPTRAVLINSGNANAATGVPGLQDATASCAYLASILKVDESSVLPFSTGVIGERLPLDSLKKGAAIAVSNLAEDNWLPAASAIMTTDTVAKCVSRKVTIAGREVVINGIAKGSGMIRPDMATMLAFIATDAQIDRKALDALLKEAAESSFNRITVDGDTSTNDSLLLIATGKAGNPEISDPTDKSYQLLQSTLAKVAVELAQMIIRDAEGATKFVTVKVSGGGTPKECLNVAYTLAESPLVKTALFAGDPNWGRLCMAIGRSGLPSLDTSRIDIFLDQTCVVQGGLKCDTYQEEDGETVLGKSEFAIAVDLGRGSACETIWTSDLSHEYIRINAEYRT